MHLIVEVGSPCFRVVGQIRAYPGWLYTVGDSTETCICNDDCSCLWHIRRCVPGGADEDLGHRRRRLCHAAAISHHTPQERLP